MGHKFLWLQFEIETPNVNTLSDIIITDITCTLEAWASVKIKSVKFMSVNDKVRNNIGQYIMTPQFWNFITQPSESILDF